MSLTAALGQMQNEHWAFKCAFRATGWLTIGTAKRHAQGVRDCREATGQATLHNTTQPPNGHSVKASNRASETGKRERGERTHTERTPNGWTLTSQAAKCSTRRQNASAHVGPVRNKPPNRQSAKADNSAFSEHRRLNRIADICLSSRGKKFVNRGDAGT